MPKQNQSGTKISIQVPLKLFASFIFFALCCQTAVSQVTTKKLDNVIVSSSTMKLLGKTKTVRESVYKPSTSKEKKQASKIEKKVPDNFKGRRNQSKAVHFDKEHQEDPVLQKEVNRRMGQEIEVLVNIRGRGLGSPTDPTGDISDQYYVQSVNATEVAVYNLDGSTEMVFPMNILWSQFNAQSAGDPIILYDENADRWFLTEFTGPANVLIAVSETNDPLGAYFAYNFTTPNFPDYPKYAITSDHLMVTTNEEGAGRLHQYFMDKAAMIAGETGVPFQRIEIPGTLGSEQGFYTSTPVDLNGTANPFDRRPIALRLNDSSWGGGPAQDQVELYRFDIDFSDVNNTVVEQTSIVTAPFDAFPCSQQGFGFQCIPQQGGQGLDGVPEVIMNIPHQRNFGSHESIVYCHITDVTAGNNLSGIRWVELRRTAETDWSVFQEGTFGPEDGLDRFMCSAAIDSKGNICLGYSVSSEDTFAGLRATGRNSTDPLGEMTFEELIIVEGQSTINSGGRFGDYSQMSVAPGGKSEFWFTSEYAGTTTSFTRVTSMSLQRDSFDMALRSFLTPTLASSELSDSESVTVEVVNSGINTIDSYNVRLLLDGVQIDEISVNDAITSDEVREHTFNSTVDLSAIGEYNLSSYVIAPNDTNPLNDTLRAVVKKLPSLEAQLTGSISAIGCDQFATGSLTLTNLGGNILTSATIGITVNGVSQPDIDYKGSLSFEQSREFNININQDLILGDNEIIASISTVNGETSDFDGTNNELAFNATIVDNTNFIVISFTTDDFPEESSYTLTDQNTGAVIFERDVFPDAATTYNDMVCVPKGACLTLTVLDSYGDGICCGYGTGSINVFDLNGNELVTSTGVFGSELELDFCNTPGECNLTAEINVVNASTDSSFDGSIMIVGSGVGPFQYSINGGVNFQTIPTFNFIQAAEYEIVVIDLTTGCEYVEIITVLAESVSTYFVGDASVEVDLIPNPTNGVFKITVDNLPTNEDFLNIEIYDIQGKIIQEREIGKYNNQFIGTFSLYAYPAGNYLVRVKSEEHNFLERIVKQ